MSAAKGITATAHKLARIVYHLVRNGEAYVRQEEEKYAGEVRTRMERQLHRRERELGYVVVKVSEQAAEPTASLA